MAKEKLDIKHVAIIMALGALGVLFLCWLSRWYRGMIVTGGRVTPPAETQAP